MKTMNTQTNLLKKLENLAFKLEGNKGDLIFVFNILKLSLEYCSIVSEMNLFKRYGPMLVNDLDEYRSRIIEIDKSRRFTHNALISGFRSIDRICSELKIDTIFNENIDNRNLSIECAKNLCDELFANGN